MEVLFATCRSLFFRSCRKRGDKWFVAMNKWQDITDMEVSRGGTSGDRPRIAR